MSTDSILLSFQNTPSYTTPTLLWPHQNYQSISTTTFSWILSTLMFALPFLHGLNFVVSHQMTPLIPLLLFYISTYASKITTLTESSSLPMAEKIWKKTVTLIDMTLSSWLQFWSGALMLPNNHVVLPLSIEARSLLVTISHVLFCLQTPTSPVPCSWLFVLLHWENQNSRRIISRLSPSYQFIYQHLHPYSLISGKLV